MTRYASVIIVLMLALSPAFVYAEDDDPAVLRAEIKMLRASARRQMEIIEQLKTEIAKLKAESAALKSGVVAPPGDGKDRPEPEERPKAAGEPLLTRAEFDAFIQAYCDRYTAAARRRVLMDKLKGRRVLVRGRVNAIKSHRKKGVSLLLMTGTLSAPITIEAQGARGEPATVTVMIWAEAAIETDFAAKLPSKEMVTVVGRPERIGISLPGRSFLRQTRRVQFYFEEGCEVKIEGDVADQKNPGANHIEIGGAE